MHPLIKAARAGDQKTVRHLLDQGCDINVRDRLNYNRTALMWAAISGSTEMVTLLLQKGADVSLVDNDDDSAFMMAAACGYPRVLWVLLKYGAPLDKVHSSGMTAVMWAAWNNRTECVKFLLSFYRPLLVIDGTSVKDIAVEAGHEIMAKIIEGEEECRKLVFPLFKLASIIIISRTEPHDFHLLPLPSSVKEHLHCYSNLLLTT